MTKEQQKDKIIEIVKKAIDENSLHDYDEESGEIIVQIDRNYFTEREYTTVSGQRVICIRFGTVNSFCGE